MSALMAHLVGAIDQSEAPIQTQNPGFKGAANLKPPRTPTSYPLPNLFHAENKTKNHMTLVPKLPKTPPFTQTKAKTPK